MAKKTVIKRKSGLRRQPKKSATKSAVRAAAKTQKKAVSRKPATARPPKGPVWQWSALQTAAAIRSSAISSVEVVEAHIARMRDVNPKLNAVVVDLSDEALKAAKAADNARTKQKSSARCTAYRSRSRKMSTMRGGPTLTGWPRR